MKSILPTWTFFVHGDPQAVFRFLRAEVPVYWHERKPGQGFWAASSYEDAFKVYHDPTTDSSERGISLQFNQGGTENGGAGFGMMMMITTVLPRHSRVRRVINRRFTPRAVSVYEQHIRNREVVIRLD